MKRVFGLLFFLFPFLAIAETQEVFVSKEPGKRKAVIEEYTGVNCGNCPDGHKAEAALLQRYPGQLFAINIHSGSFAEPPIREGDPVLKTVDGNSLLSTFKINLFPAAVLNRHTFNNSYEMGYRPNRETAWNSCIQEILALDSYVNIAAKGELDWATRKLKLTVQLYYTRDVSGTASNRIHVAMLQDEIIAAQSGSSANPAQVTGDGRYRHLHVLRDMLTPISGDTVKNIGKDALITRSYEWNLPEVINDIPLDLINTSFVVYVAESQYEIFNACEPELNHINAPETAVSISDVESNPSYSCDYAGRASLTFTNRWGEDISEATFSLRTSWGNTEYTYKADPVLQPGQSARILTDAFAARPNGEESVIIKVTAVNGKPYEADSTAINTVGISAHYAFTHDEDITLNIKPDNYGEDITWTFRNTKEDDILYQGGPYESSRLQSVPMQLEKGCYALTVYDKQGDGLDGGYISFVSQDKEFYRHNGKYDDRVVIMLDTRENAANGKSERVESLTIRPNPANDHTVISFTTQKTDLVRVRILSRTGACVLDLGNVRTEAGSNRIELPLQNLVPGMYFVSLHGESVQLSSKLVIVR